MRDVTGLVRYSSNIPAIASVSDAGVVYPPFGETISALLEAQPQLATTRDERNLNMSTTCR